MVMSHEAVSWSTNWILLLAGHVLPRRLHFIESAIVRDIDALATGSRFRRANGLVVNSLTCVIRNSTWLHTEILAFSREVARHRELFLSRKIAFRDRLLLINLTLIEVRAHISWHGDLNPSLSSWTMLALPITSHRVVHEALLLRAARWTSHCPDGLLFISVHWAGHDRTLRIASLPAHLVAHFVDRLHKLCSRQLRRRIL